MMIRLYDGLDEVDRERQARVLIAARNVLARQHSMVADIDPAVIRVRAIAAARVGLSADVRTF